MKAVKLDSYKPQPEAFSSSQPFKWSLKPYLNQSQYNFQASTWVKLLELPTPFSSDEALLLCQDSEDQWLAWVPDYGEIVLHPNQFCQAD